MSQQQQMHLPPHELQLINERRFNPKHVDGYIRKAILENPSNKHRLDRGVELVKEWLAAEWYPSKKARLEQLNQLELEALVLEILVGTAYCLQEQLFTSVSSQLAGRLGFTDKVDSLTTSAELLAVLCETDAYDICKPYPQAQLTIVTRLELSEELVEYIDNTSFLPPLVCPPKFVENNHQSGYYTHNDSLLLGKGNHHNGDLCLDVINTQNQVPLKFDLDFLCTVEETPNTPITWENVREAALDKGVVLTEVQAKEEARIQLANWDGFKHKSYQYYTLLAKQGNRFWLTHKWDKRGRLYSIGYHINTQASAFKKATIELATEEVVEVPAAFRV